MSSITCCLQSRRLFTYII